MLRRYSPVIIGDGSVSGFRNLSYKRRISISIGIVRTVPRGIYNTYQMPIQWFSRFQWWNYPLSRTDDTSKCIIEEIENEPSKCTCVQNGMIQKLPRIKDSLDNNIPLYYNDVKTGAIPIRIYKHYWIRTSKRIQPDRTTLVKLIAWQTFHWACTKSRKPTTINILQLFKTLDAGRSSRWLWRYLLTHFWWVPFLGIRPILDAQL